MRALEISSVSFVSAFFHASSNSRCTQRRLGLPALLGERGLQAEERSRVARMLFEIFAEHALGVGRAAGREQRRAQRLAHRIEPHRRLVVGKLIGRGDRLLPELDRAIVLAARMRDARVERERRHVSALAAVAHPPPPNAAVSGTAAIAAVSSFRSAAASSTLPVFASAVPRAK